MDQSNQPEQTKPKTSLLKLFLLVIFFPFTLSYLIWKQNKLPVFARILGIIVLWSVFIGIGSSNSNKTDQKQTMQVPVTTNQTVTPSNTPEPTKELTFKDKLLALAQKTTTKEATVEYDEKEKLATVTIPKSVTYWDDTAIVKSSWAYFVKFGLEAFKLPEVNEIGIQIRMDFVDSYGKTSEGNGVTIFMKKANFEKFTWENLRFKDITQQLTDNGDYFVHGALWKKVKQQDLKLSY